MAKKQTSRKSGIGDTFNANLNLICDARGITDERVMEYMNVCRSTFYDRKLHHPGKWTVENIESAAKLFGIPAGDMMARVLTPQEVA